MTTALILFSIAITSLIWCIIITIVTHNEVWLFSLALPFVLSVCGAASVSTTPTDFDVKKGNAYYMEQNHVEVINGDTINNYKTYEIIWNQNTK